MVAFAALEYDAELMLRVKEGDAASFALLLEKYRLPVIHFLYRMIQDHGISEELGQEVFLRVYRSRATYAPTAKFTTWLFRIATHLALNWLRDGKNEKGSGSMTIVARRLAAMCRTGDRPWSMRWSGGQGWMKCGARWRRCRISRERRS